MATNKNFEVKNGLTIAGTERITSAGAFTGSLASATTATTQSATDNSTKIATTAYTDAAITAVIGGAPGTLDTLNELAAAINDDASYASTLTTALATKLPLAGGTMTGNIAHASDFTIDAGGDISLDADGEQIRFKDGGTEIGHIDMGSQNLTIRSKVSDKDIEFHGTDNGSNVNALTLDMSDAGRALFNEGVKLSGLNGGTGLAFNMAGSGDYIIKESSTSDVMSFQGGLFHNFSSNNFGILASTPSRILDIQLTATNGSLHNNNNAAVHFGSGSGNTNSDGYIQGISLGYKTTGANTYAKVAIVARGLNDGAARQSLAFLVDTTSDGGSAEIGDAKLTIHGTTGNVGIGTSVPGAKLEISGKDDAGASDLLALQFDNSPADTGMTFRDIFSGVQSRFTLDSSNTNDLRISSGTQMHFYGGTSNGTGDGHLKINSSGHFTSVYGMIVSTATFAEVSNVGFGSYNNGAWVNSKSGTNGWLATAGNGVLRWNSSSVYVNGSLSKNSGSFKIPHPLPSKNSTHALVHSFIEGPQADNIYRGVVDLVDGTATINIDTVSGMTEGTYVLLNTNTSCFTSNETNWDAVKGSVSGNILTINCQNSSSTATVSWLVIGERHDQHMKDTDWTDSDGKVIVEPLKEQEVNLGD